MADDPDATEVDDERTLELSTVAAIYPELLVDPEGVDPFSACLEVSVEPIAPLLIRFPTADGAPLGGLPTPPDSVSTGNDHIKAPNDGETAQDIHHLSHLPPLNLQISLPEGYPAENPPVVQLESQCSWLPEKRIQELTEAVQTTWEDMGRDQAVFSYIDHLREAAERGFDLVKDEAQALDVSADLKVALLDYDLKAKRTKFERETFECGVCLEPKKGTVCHRLLLCSHVFCVECLQDFYNNCISEGDIGNVKCITPNCRSEPGNGDVKHEVDRSLEPSELLQIPLEQEMVQRYIKLKRKKRLESDKSTIYCPRQWCQGPARCPNKKPAEPKSDDADNGDGEPKQYDRNTDQNLLPPPAERLAICEDCTFAFCKVCKASWHGEFFVCFPRSQFELTTEEKASEDYMKLHTQPCPTCDARAQKTHGCNHMICFKCDTHFCYLCGAYLDKGNPYEHYNTRKSGCYMRLWELEGGDDGEIGQAFAGGGVDVDSDESDDDEVRGPIGAPPVPDAPVVARDNEPPAPVVARDNEPAAPVRRGPAAAAQQNGGPGLQRFLQMVQADEEDGWDSDEMDDADGFQEWGDGHN